MSDQRGPLLRQSHLQPGESLPSFLARLARLNHYDPLSILNRLCLSDSPSREQAICPTQIETFEQVADLTGLDPLVLYASTAHRFAAILARPEDPVESWTLPRSGTVPRLVTQNLSRQLRPTYAAQFCPVCLQHSTYHRLAWVPTAVAVCLQHQCLLVDRCPGCRALVTIQSITAARCDKCQADLIQGRVISTHQDTVGMLAQRTLYAWLMDGAPSPEHVALRLPPDQPPSMLYQVLNELRLRTLQAGAGWRYLHRIVGGPRGLTAPSLATHYLPTSDRSYRLSATAFKALLNWPQGFCTFLDAYCCRGRVKGESVRPFDPRDLYSWWFNRQWKDPAFQFMRLAFEEYLIARYPEIALSTNARQHHNRPIRSEQFAWVTIAEAAQLLQAPPELILRLVGLGRLIALRPAVRNRASYDFVRRAEVLALRRQWHEALSLSEAAWWLGLSSEMVQALVTTGRLMAEYAPAAVKGTAWRISKQAVVYFWSTLMSKAEFQMEASSEMIELRWIIYGLSHTRLSASAILERVLSGQLRAYRPMSPAGGLDELRFAKQDLREAAWPEE